MENNKESVAGWPAIRRMKVEVNGGGKSSLMGGWIENIYLWQNGSNWHCSRDVP